VWGLLDFGDSARSATVDFSDTDAWVKADGVYKPAESEDSLAARAAVLDGIITGAITRDSNGAATSASVEWPDGATGTYTADTVSTTFPGAVDAYHVTHVLDGTTKTFTQPAVTRDPYTGAVTNRPAITVA
jgi:hypothetical protein